jgi:hypothetical protein
MLTAKDCLKPESCIAKVPIVTYNKMVKDLGIPAFFTYIKNGNNNKKEEINRNSLDDKPREPRNEAYAA